MARGRKYKKKSARNKKDKAARTAHHATFPSHSPVSPALAVPKQTNDGEHER